MYYFVVLSLFRIIMYRTVFSAAQSGELSTDKICKKSFFLTRQAVSYRNKTDLIICYLKGTGIFCRSSALFLKEST